MTRRRIVGAFFGILGVALVALLLYVAFADLGRHKARIEALVTRSVGRPFAIDGPFTLKLVPVVEVSAERVRLGNVQGGSQPQMIEFNKAVVKIGLWSLISGPPDVHLFELHDARILLERGSDGKGNWIMGAPKADDESGAERDGEMDDETDEEAAAPEVPVVIRSAQLNNVRLIYREAKKHDRVVQVDKLTIAPGKEGLLALDGVGKLDAYALSLKGEAGPLKALLSARDMRVDLTGSLGELALDIRGVLGRLHPFDGADLTLKVEHPELGSMLRRLEFPVIAEGRVQIEGRLEDAGDLTRLDFDAKVGQLTASTQGTIRTLSLKGANLKLAMSHPEVGTLLQALELPAVASGAMQIDAQLKDAGKRRQVDAEAKLGDLHARVKGSFRKHSLDGSDLEFEANAPDAARLAQVFAIKEVPAAPLIVKGRLTTSRKEFKFEPLTAVMAGATLSMNGAWQRTPDHGAVFQFVGAAENLAKLGPDLPAIKASARGAVEFAKDKIEGKSLEVTMGDTQLSGSFLLNEARQFEADITSPRLDFTPFLGKTTPGNAPTAAELQGASASPKKKFVFSEEPLGLEKMKDADVKVHLVAGELRFGERSLKDFDGNLHVDNGKMKFDARAAGVHDGTVAGTGTFTPGNDGSADLDLKLDLSNVRASLASEGLLPGEVPPLGVGLDLRIHGSSAREMASGANGHLLLTQGAGKIRSGLLGAIGGGVLGQLGQKLNPFAKDDPFMKLDCTVARADIVNGQVTLKPIVVQSEKVTVTAHGNIDLHTEKLLIDFNTRPRKGIGVSPGMFTNPLIRLEGTLVNPRIGVGAKGLASGAVAAATGGVTVVAGGLLDRMVGEQDLCKKTLADVMAHAAH